MTRPLKPSFTRYLYERCHVEYSLQIALFEKQREETLFWAYELYHSGFQEEVWGWVRDLYMEYYVESNPRFETWLDRLYLQWKETCNACLLGTVVGTLALRDTGSIGDLGKGEMFILLYTEDRHATREVKGNPRNYLKHVSQYPIRSKAIDLVYHICNISPELIRDAYLGPNWLYYCTETPIWAFRIQEGGGKVIDERVVFETDDLLEEFYERWGFEPDEQCMEIHQCHGIDLSSRLP